MKNIKEFILKIKIKINNKIEKIDSKTNPEKGKKLYGIFKKMSLILILAGIPVIGFAFGIFSLAGGLPWVATIVAPIFFAAIFLNLFLWFWFSKFNN